MNHTAVANPFASTKRGSIRTRLLTAFLSLALVPLLIITLITFFLSQQSITKITTENLNTISAVQVQALQAWLNTFKFDVAIITQSPDAQSMDSDSAKTMIDNYLAQWQNYEGMFIALPDGQTIATETENQVNVGERDYFKEALKGQTVISQPVISKASGNVVIVAAAPIYRDGKIVGVVGLTTATTVIKNMLTEAQLGDTGEAYLIQSDGLMITASRYESELKAQGEIENISELEYKVRSKATDNIATGDSGSGIYENYLGTSVVGAYRYIPEMNWGMVVEQSQSEATSTVTTLLIISLSVFAVSGIVVFILAYLNSRAIANPIKSISAIAEELSVGKINQQVSYQSNDEVGELADSFRAMIAYQKGMAQTAEAIADGDLTIHTEALSAEDVLGNAFTRMASNLRKALEQIARNTRSVETSSTTLAESARQADSVTTQIATTIQQVATGTTQQSEASSRTASAVEQLSRAIDGVAKGAQEQAAAITRMSGLTSQLSNAIEKVSQNAREVTEGAKNASQTADQGARIVETTVEGMTRIRQKVNLSAQKVEEMGSRSDQIGAIVATIEDIASQTNLLALNAAIEAARAGEHGKGFAVVADEVRKLAEKSSAATKEIGGLIKGIQQIVAEAVVAMHESAGEVEAGVQHAGDAGQALQEILSSSNTVHSLAETVTVATTQMLTLSNDLITAGDEVSAIVEENTAATEEMSASSNEITHAIENIASVSEENSASAEEVSASAEEMSAQVEEVSQAAASLAEMSDQLATIVATFKLN